jgi:hypothetical protein
MSDKTPARYNVRAALGSIVFSLILNALMPYLVYRTLEPRYPAGSVVPLLYATAFPVFGFILGLIRKRQVDAIAILSMVGIAIHMAVTVLVGNVGLALVARSLDGLVIGVVLVVSAAIGRPVVLYVARQAAAGSGQPSRIDALLAAGGMRAFTTITYVWGIFLIVMSAVHVVLALRLTPSTYLLASPALGIVTNLLLVVWSGWFLGRRLRKLREVSPK